ncbi:hypothetical protein [Kaistella carnis]|uniref:Uncharacterized protein n=1 Tax=Kaistella carnis TaxID=1241979 RepID=A0A3G8XQB5_9FLAO|nr:hypothetical protein [Kaistella carnis]AZI33957.1 hypothetical protein EIB73_12505 [Kaistella carnis]
MKTDRIKSLTDISHEIARKKRELRFQMLATSTQTELNKFIESFENGGRYNAENIPKTNGNSSNFHLHAKHDTNVEREDKSANMDIYEKDFILCEFEAGLRDSHPFSKVEVAQLHRNWMQGFLQDYFNEAEEVTITLNKLSDSVITEFRQRMYEKKYWHHIEEAHYDYRKYFLSLLISYFKNEKPKSQIAKKVDFKKLFSAKALQELHTVFTMNKTHFDNFNS